MKRKQSPQYSAPALEKGLDILEYLVGQHVARSQTEIAQYLNRSQSEIYRMLACLEGRGYVLKEEGSGNYRVSLRLYQLAHEQSPVGQLRGAALLPMEALAEATRQSCHLSVQQGSMLIVLMERTPARHICLAVGEGTCLPLSRTASGMVLLSRMPGEVAARVLCGDPHYKAASKNARKALLSTLSGIRSKGHLVTESSLTESTTDIAIPVGVNNTDTAAVMALSFVSPAGARSPRTAAYLKSALASAAQINKNLGIKT